MFDNLLRLIIVIGLSSFSLGLGLFEECQFDSQCTYLHTTCRLYTCNSTQCLCKVGYAMTMGIGSRNICRKQSLLGEPCESPVECSATSATCSLSNVCECKTKFRPSRDKLRCYRESEKDLGDFCEGRDYCGITADCVNSKCACRDGHVPWTSPEIWTWIHLTKVKPCQNLYHYVGSCGKPPGTAGPEGPPGSGSEPPDTSAAASVHNNNALSWLRQTLSRWLPT